jgi:hypothetical protein
MAIGVVLTQGQKNQVDLPIYYASRLLNHAEKNYTAMEKEALTMVYVVKNFRHYLLTNHFIFYVNH